MKISKHVKGTKLLASLLVILHLFTYSNISVAAANEGNDIDTGIASLNYDRNEVLAVKGDQISSFVPKEGLQSNGKFIVVEREKKSLATSPVDISIIDSMTNRTYPGAIQLANQSFADNQPDLIMAKRQPLDISIDLPGLKNENTITVQNPTYSSVSGAVDQLVSTWVDKYSSTHTLPARLQYAESMVHSKNQIASALNVNAQVLNNTLGIDFNAVESGEKKVMVAAYKQIFYTVNAALPNNPSDLFDQSVTFNELVRKGVSNESPPLMVSNVAYGRTIYVKLETTSKSSDVQAAFKALLRDSSVQSSGQYKDIYENSSFTAVVLGGDAQTHNQIVTKDFNVIQNIIKDNAQFSPRNPAYPISYTSVFLKDNAVAAVRNNTEYIETKSTEYTKGKITLNHYGAYVAEFEVSWDEVTYDANGQEIITHKVWEESGWNKTASFSTEIPLPPNARNIKILARECTGLAWDWWRTVINETDVPLTSHIKVSIGGTTLHPTGSITY
ncbi:thiol-activated cytolysin family protein [Paenibacillus agilis]|uniref:Thiol-activated cytolysin n=1 Tax=Paenibacillus agilis TaxID=3020863 RepID=A0A559IHY5_9BACL|nr:thiol-activated cytolysin family protein [Paenibacillus agilis]TVX87120.1 alveolysin [Paenibacillus agilis]